jgi:hypothetical protein
MATTADDPLRSHLDQFEKALRDAYAQGWADCFAALQGALEAVRAPSSLSSHAPGRSKPKSSPTEGEASGLKQTPRGVTGKLVEEILRDSAPRPISQLEIIRAAETRDGTKLAYTTLRRMIDQLVTAGKVEQIPGTKTWRYLPRQVIGGGDPGGEAPGSLEPLESMAAE